MLCSLFDQCSGGYPSVSILFFPISDPSKKDDAFYTREREIDEIESLVPEIREKIADTRDMQVETNKKLGDKVREFLKVTGNVISSRRNGR